MIFTKLTLKNFKSHKDSVIDFKPGISIIVGENGAGKSSILDGISFALFKQFNGKINDLVRITKNKNSHELMSVSLEFISNGKEYIVNRTRGSTSKAELIVKDSDGGSTRISSGDSSVNNEIQTILEMDGELFLNAIYIQQGEIANLISKTPSEKKKLIGRLLGVESLEKAWKNSLPLINIYENQKSELDGRTASSLDLNNDLKNKKIILEEIKIKGNSIEKEIKELEQLKSLKANEKLEMEKSKSTFDKLNTQLINENENTRRVIDERKKLQEQLENLKNKEKEMLSLEKFSNKLPIYLEFLESVNNLEHLTKDRNNYEEKLANIRKQKDIIKNEEEGYNHYLQVQKKLKVYNDRKSKLESELGIIKELEKNRSDIKKEFYENIALIEDFFNETTKSLNIDFSTFENSKIDFSDYDKEEIDFSNQKNFNEISNNFKDLKRIIIDFKIGAESKIKEIDSKSNNISNKVSGLEEGINSAKEPLSEIKKVDNQCPICKSDITEEKKNDLIDSYNNKIKFNQESINKFNNELKKISNEKSIFKTKLDEINSVEKDIQIKYKYYEIAKKELEKISDIDIKLKTYEDTRDKLDNVLLSIKDQNKLQEMSKESYDKYVHASGSLDVLGKEYDTKDKLRELERNIDIEVEKLKVAMSKDSYLSPDIRKEDLKNRIDDLRDKDKVYNQLKGEIVQLPILESQIKNKSDEFDTIRSKVDNIENNIKACNYSKNKYENVVFTYERSEEKLKMLNKEINEIKGKATQIISDIENLTVKLTQNDILKEKLENVTDYLKLLKDIRELFSKDGIQKDLRNRSKPLIQKNTKEFFEQFNFNYSDLKIDEDYNISVFGPEGESKLDMVSGGEKIAIALALRLGITKAMSKGNIETILLDEPTIHLDSFRRHELIYLLRQMSSLPQMIIVTHDSELENAADNIIKVEKNDGISEINEISNVI
ncbi:double-stranded DNA repair protein Rad50 [Methanobrevibacter arboriphilus]|jgi:exonuclease SbcC|uniref:Double-stranded DNA repair protein Rad50 n=2 Tax=Methanobrevibacter arboriphilus TaxID=39441 RepID=A0ACA8R1P8_METAZ|nr:AAA family ATPase [Methanobrevibacter arboriphilus]MCC7561347.1 AAA family ATPase [Methanobrevibacter arboriphilus]BBL61201.1 double-stranded DNA repair protein Rad50 [Methanobrevibacter arboriphilus]GLI12825.1 double-stranded DNA repair protein Rad50 [Methanobrevibacter arboriphilus]